MDSDLLQGFYLNGVWVEPLKGEVHNQGRIIHLARQRYALTSGAAP